MGTRGAHGFRVRGEDKVAYNDKDSYPDCLGEEVIRFIQQIGSVKRLRSIARRMDLVDEDDAPTFGYLGIVGRLIALVVKWRRHATGWHYLSLEYSRSLDWYRRVGCIPGNAEFLLDGLFCEWAYIINVDSETLEIYATTNSDNTPQGRYCTIHPEPDMDGEVRRGVSLLFEVPLSIVIGMSDVNTDRLVSLLTELPESGIPHERCNQLMLDTHHQE
ncbi:hypothetical protein KIPB_000862 [Kipferlia bialata]|uniref:Uncharacterized protein n=1 Tax=Kipferlia bialata TaxID=797122 RepID=A0A9K3CN30_9EUKA|nr:hypothetical protein KIPB_000862 [Kipferlia bialata]|eukprot:g862.t1